MTLGAGIKSSQSGSYVTTIIQNFILVSLASTTMHHPAGLPFRAMIPSHPMHSTIYLILYCLCSWKVFLAIKTICALPTYWEMRLSFLKRHWMAWSLSGWLDAIKLALSLCRRQPCYWYWSGLLARWRKFTFGMSSVLVRVYQLDDKRAPLECHRIWWQKTDISKLLLRQSCS